MVLKNSFKTVEVKTNEKILENKKIENEKKQLLLDKEKILNEKLEVIFKKINTNCSIKAYANINSNVECNKKELEDYISITLWHTAKELWMEKQLNDLNWIKKTVWEMTKKDIEFLPTWSEIKDDIVLHKYNNPNDLYYWIHVNDKPYVTQWMLEHYELNKRLAVDIWVNKIKRWVYAPDFKNKEIEYKVKRVKSYDYWDWVELSFLVNWVEYKWIYWHVTLFPEIKDWDIVKTWQVIWKLNLTWIYTEYHLHLELWQQDNQVLYVINPIVLQERKKHNK